VSTPDRILFNIGSFGTPARPAHSDEPLQIIRAAFVGHAGPAPTMGADWTKYDKPTLRPPSLFSEWPSNNTETRRGAAEPRFAEIRRLSARSSLARLYGILRFSSPKNAGENGGAHGWVPAVAPSSQAA